MAVEALSTNRAINGPSEGSLATRIVQAVNEVKAASAPDLAELLSEPEADVAKTCEELVRKRRLGKLLTPDLEIIHAVDGEARSAKNGGWVATTNLDRGIGMNGRTAYPRCKRLEERLGLLRSERVKGDRLRFFFPVTGQILTNTNYEGVQAVVDDLKAIARRSGLAPGVQIPPALKKRLISEYRQYFLRLRQGKPRSVREQIDAFEGQLMAVLAGTTVSDVVGFLGVRPFRPWIRVWRLDREGNPTGPLIDAVIGWIVLHLNGGGSLPGPVYIPVRQPRETDERSGDSAAEERTADLKKTA